MNILHHKSWHVRNRNNIERVRRDEQNARNEELELQKRIDLADSEARVGLLRQKLPQRQHTSSSTVANTDGQHLDLFEDFSDKIKTTNAEHEREAIEEKEKFEKKTGILQYLVDKEVDSDHNWYMESHEKRMKLTDSTSVAIDSEKTLKDNKWKKLNDPIEDMKKYLDSMKSSSGEKSIKPKKMVKSIEFVKSNESSVKSKKRKKHKKHKKRKTKRKTVSDQSSDDDSDDTRLSKTRVSKNLQQLRAERLERERVERERTRALLSGQPLTSAPAVEMDDRLRTYNSQFNPEIARQNQNIEK